MMKRKKKIMKKREKKKEEKKTKSELAKEKKEVVSCSGKEAPYPLVSSKKDKEWHFACFLDIFKKLEITIPFVEALKQMPLYSKFLKDLLTKKGKYIHSDNIMVEGNSNFTTVVDMIVVKENCKKMLKYFNYNN